VNIVRLPSSFSGKSISITDPFKPSKNGEITQEVTHIGKNNNITVHFPAGAKAKDANGNPYTSAIYPPASISRSSLPADLPSWLTLFKAFKIETSTPIIFDQDITLTIPLAVNLITQNPQVYSYNMETGQYELVGDGGSIATDREHIIAKTRHFSFFVVGKLESGANNESQPTASPDSEGAETYSFFPDLPDSHWASKYISELYQLGIMQGYNGEFRPDQFITRAELLKIALLGFNIHIIDFAPENPFSDVNIEDWAAPYLYTAKMLKYIEGYADGRYKPNENINRAEALKIVLSILKNKNEEIEKSLDNLPKDTNYAYFEDNPKTAWFAKLVAFASQNEIVTGYPDKLFHPEKNITRAEAAKIIILIKALKD
jgi:hypothetical protein